MSWWRGLTAIEEVINIPILLERLALNLVRNGIQHNHRGGWVMVTGLTFNAVISLEVPPEELVERLVRRAGEASRSDDNLATIRLRQQIYAESTAPLLDYYKGRGILIEIDGTGTIDEVTDRIRDRLDRLDLS